MRKRKITALFISIVIFAAVLALAQTKVPTAPAQPQAPALPTQPDQFGGRPGTFHFLTNEQAMADTAELQKALAAVQSLEAELAKLDNRSRDRLSPGVQALRSYLLNLQTRQAESAGDTARQVEANLNSSKGKFMCGACHRGDMGMMHRGRMGMMQGRGRQ